MWRKADGSSLYFGSLSEALLEALDRSTQPAPLAVILVGRNDCPLLPVIRAEHLIIGGVQEATG